MILIRRRFFSSIPYLKRQTTFQTSEGEPFSHTPVLVKEAIRLLNVGHNPSQKQAPKKYLDLTFGCGGHTKAILGNTLLFDFSFLLFLTKGLFIIVSKRCGPNSYRLGD